jgi:GNAT superfamily N-acetyltransferase
MTTLYLDVAHKSLQKVLKKRVDDTWHLNMVMTHPDYQGRGCLSMIVREQYKFAPDATFTLEASSPKSRNQYAHLGFEVRSSIQSPCTEFQVEIDLFRFTDLSLWGKGRWELMVSPRKERQRRGWKFRQ